jgi:peptidylprolyl isomerase
MMPLMRSRPAAAFTFLAALSPLAALAQATTPATTAKPVVHRTTTHTTAAHAANPADNPPGVPKVVGTPKPLYALRYVDIVTGTGPLAAPRKYFTVQYTGWLTNGTKFDSSYDHGAPYSFPYGARQVIPGWDTGFEGMHVGGKRRLYIPYQLAYGETGRPPVIPAKADLIFDLELISFSDTPPARPEPPAPPKPAPDSAQPPTDPTKPTATPPPPGSSSPSSPSANPGAPPPTQSTTPSTQPPTSTNPANR